MPDVIIVNRHWQARGQLDTAIAVWFHYGDPVSIHTLAAAAQGILRGVGGKKHPSPLLTWLKTQPKAFQKKITEPQNVFKHAGRDSNVVRDYQPHIGELIIADATLLYEDIYHTLTPFMRAFDIRLAFEHPTIYTPNELTKKVTKGIRIDDLGVLSRPACLATVRSRLAAIGIR
jgi:hypothetical protein